MARPRNDHELLGTYPKIFLEKLTNQKIFSGNHPLDSGQNPFTRQVVFGQPLHRISQKGSRNSQNHHIHGGNGFAQIRLHGSPPNLQGRIAEVARIPMMLLNVCHDLAITHPPSQRHLVIA